MKLLFILCMIPLSVVFCHKTDVNRSISGIWSGKYIKLSDMSKHDLCWQFKDQDSILYFDDKSTPTGIPDGRGTWTLIGNTFKTKVYFPSLYTDSAILSGDFKSMNGKQTENSNGIEYATFSLIKQ